MDKKVRSVIFAAAVGTFMSALDASVVNIALPSISRYFGAPLYIIEWVVMAYLLVISSLLLTYGRLGDMYGHKRLFVTGFAIFTAGSLLCGMAQGKGCSQDDILLSNHSEYFVLTFIPKGCNI